MIHYHGLPLSGSDWVMVRAMKGKHGMVSFERPDQLEEAAEVCQSVALDNGSFSAWKGEREYDFEGYLEWCGKWLRHPGVEWAVIPDVIDGDAGACAEANERLLSQWPYGARGVPVWHLHEPLERLEWLAKKWGRIALGSSGAYAEPGAAKWWSRIANVMRIVCDEEGYPKVKLHGLRMLDPVIFSHVPFASADSCNVARNMGIDSAWRGTYAPASRVTRALILIERIEAHAAAARWNGAGAGVQQNMELFG